MRRVLLMTALTYSLVVAQPAVAMLDFDTSATLANARRKSAYQTVLYFTAILSVFDVVVGAIWSSSNEALPSTITDPNERARAQTIYGVSAASTAVAGLAAIASGSLAIRATHETWLLDMHHDQWAKWVAFREYFTPFVLLAQAGLQTWAGIEISRLVPSSYRLSSMFWVTTGFMIGAFSFAVFMPITGAILTRHRPVK